MGWASDNWKQIWEKRKISSKLTPNLLGMKSGPVSWYTCEPPKILLYELQKVDSFIVTSAIYCIQQKSLYRYYFSLSQYEQSYICN